MTGVARVSFVIGPIFVRTILQTTTDPIRTPGGAGQNCIPGTPPDQAATEALLGASGKRLCGLLKECFAHTGRGLRVRG